MKHILTFNWHEGYITLLSKIPDVSLTIVERPKGGYDRWMHEFRPCPRGSRILSMKEALEELRAEKFDAVIANDPTDLLSTHESPVPQFLVVHNRLDTMIALGGGQVDRNNYLDWFKNLVRMVSDLQIVFISPSKKDNWGIDGTVILPGVESEGWGPANGVNPQILWIGNFLKERDLMLGYGFGEEVLRGIPHEIVGINPTLPNSRMTRSLEDLRSLYRDSRAYLNATTHPYEDGYNLALLEAMASGMPIIARSHPGSPVAHGRSGFLSENPESLAVAAKRLMEDRELARSMGEAAREDVLAAYPMSRFVERWAGLLDRKISGWQDRKKYRQERGEIIDRIPAGAETILDIGCGAGTTGRGIRERLGEVQLIGIEKDPGKARDASRIYDRVIETDARTWSPDLMPESIDVLIFADVLEHTEDPKSLLLKYLPYLGPSGVVLMSIPNVRYHKVVKDLAQGQFRYENDGILDRSHLRFFTRQSMIELINEAGLWVEGMSANVDNRYHLVTEGFDLADGKKADIDLGALVVRDQDAAGVQDLFTIQYLFTARKKIDAIFDRVDQLSTQGSELDLVSVLEEARQDQALTGEEKAEIDVKIGEIAARRKRWDEARNAYRRALETLVPGRDERPYLGMGVVELLTGCFQEALLWFKKAYDLNPNSWKSLSGFGMCCHQLGQPDDALYYYGKSLEMEIDQDEIMGLTIELARSLGTPEKALEPLRIFTEKFPFKEGFRTVLASLYYESHRPDEALAEIDRVLFVNKSNREALRLREQILAMDSPAQQVS